MKYLILLFAFSSVFFISFTKKSKSFRPPGTSKIVDNFYFDEGEITNIDWKEYLFSLKQEFGEASLNYTNAQPDTLVWQTNDSTYNEPFVSTYFQHPSYDYYPVVGISHKQAKAYCKWRTEAVKTMMATNGIEKVNFEYRLPTKTEWELVARAGFNDKQKRYIKKRNRKLNQKMRFFNMIYQSENDNLSNMTAPSRSYLPNKYNVYNIYGNVAEMIDEPNIAMGGSWKDVFEEVVPSNKTLSYDGPQKWLGFRCVAEIYSY